MKRSPLNTPHSSRTYGARHTPYNWKLHENANGKGYQSMRNNSYQRFPVNNELQPCGDNFIPLNVTTPVQHEKHNRCNPTGERNNASPGSGWYNYRNNYHTTPRSNCNNRYSAYKHSNKQFYGQKRKSYKGIYRQANISAYIDMDSFLEDPWEDLVKKLNDSEDINECRMPKNESLSNLKLVDSDSVEKSESELPSNINLDDSQCSQEFKNEDSINTSFETENIDLSQISKVNSSINLEIGNICSIQDSLNESASSNNDKIYGAVQDDNTHLNALLADTNQKNI